VTGGGEGCGVGVLTYKVGVDADGLGQVTEQTLPLYRKAALEAGLKPGEQREVAGG
jgi:hypothetical protein